METGFVMTAQPATLPQAALAIPPEWLGTALDAEFGAAATDIGARWMARFQAYLGDDGNFVPSHRHPEFVDVLQLLLEHAADAGPDTSAIARWIALTCMGEDHLWEDLGLPERPALSAMIGRRFPALHAKNGANMRWKKFFYKQLCERADVFACRAPSCGECSEYANCFTPVASPV